MGYSAWRLIFRVIWDCSRGAALRGVIKRGLYRNSHMHLRKRSMKHYVGMDVSVKETSLCIVDEAGGICRELKVSSHPEARLRE